MDSIVHGIAKSWIQLSDFHFTPALYNSGCSKMLFDHTIFCKKNKAITHIDRLILVMFYLLKVNPSYTNKGPSSQGYGFSSSHVWM